MRNRKLDAAKAVAACFVVFIHIGFPGRAGEIIRALARFAVPFFFMVSGYFCYCEGDCAIQKIPRKIRHIAGLAALSGTFYFVWEFLWCILEQESIKTWLSAIFQTETLKNFLLYNTTSAVKMHLWFLPALIYCYAVVYLLEKLHMRKKAYPCILILLGICLWRACFCKLFGGFYHTMQYRNYLFTGIPFFLLGEWIHEYRKENILTDKKAAFAMCAGIAWTILEYCRMGQREIYAGTILFTVSFFLWAVSDTKLPDVLKSFADIGKDCSFYIYLFHLAAADVLIQLIKNCSLEKNVFWLWTRPVLVCVLTIAGICLTQKAFPNRRRSSFRDKKSINRFCKFYKV